VDANGRPFPTLYWLTCPEAVKVVSRLEADGWIGRLNERARADEGFAAALRAAHRAYASERGSLADGTEAIGGVAGTREGIKCLHAHYAFHLAGGLDPIGEWVAERVEPIHAGSPSGRVAAIDQGTNSIRLLVAEPSPGDELAELARDMVITRLGKGVDATGRLDPDALERTIAVLERYCRRAGALGAERIRVGATSAVRDTANRGEFEAAVRENAGSELEVITGEQEAGLSFLGATRGLARTEGLEAPAPYSVLDIGGGSTELVLGTDAPESSISTQMGSVRLTERHVANDPPEPGELRAMQSNIQEILASVEDAVPVRLARTLVAVAGTATTLQAAALDLPRYDPDAIHRTWISLEDVDAQLERLARMTTPERAALPYMAPGRGDVIVAGATILVVVMRRFAFERALVSETDILDGLAIEMLQESDTL
jgi:exopolyphosphatase/guanosine-5'-triphosphate,3'-diphosphate pyrophosphatase